MQEQILSLRQYENKIHKKKFSIVFQVYLIAAISFNLLFIDSVQNSTSNISEIYNANEIWVEHWFTYYSLGKLTDPITGKKLTKRKVKNLGLSVMKWESDNNPNQITWEKTVKGNSYGQYALLSPTAKAMGWKGTDPKELLDPETNAQYSMKFLCMQIAAYEGDVVAGLAAYNGGRCRTNKYGEIRNQYYIDGVYPIYVRFNRFIMDD